ncbi:hypothetical protein BC828DRAFT_227536 [Blastocladiella britannica]|nr:hypothetical protein BC828DRAFT_227536 [Blastocladiella britannica]
MQDPVRRRSLAPVVKAAAKAGDIAVMEWIVAVYDPKWKPPAKPKWTCPNSHLEELKRSLRPKLGAHSRRALAFLQWWEANIEDFTEVSSEFLASAVVHGHVPIFAMFYDRCNNRAGKNRIQHLVKAAVTSDTIAVASYQGHIAMLEWLHDQSPKLRTHMKKVASHFKGNGHSKLLDLIAGNGGVASLEFWFKFGSIGLISPYAAEFASRAGHTAVLGFMMAQSDARIAPFYSTASAVDEAPARGQVPVMEWWWILHRTTRSSPFVFGEAAINKAAAPGHLLALRWWWSKHEKFKVDLAYTNAAMTGAATLGRIDILNSLMAYSKKRSRGTEKNKLTLSVDAIKVALGRNSNAVELFCWWVTHFAASASQGSTKMAKPIDEVKRAMTRTRSGTTTSSTRTMT